MEIVTLFIDHQGEIDQSAVTECAPKNMFHVYFQKIVGNVSFHTQTLVAPRGASYNERETSLKCLKNNLASCWISERSVECFVKT